MSADHTTVIRAQKQMQECVLQLDKMSSDVADARQVKEFNHERVKRAFSVLVAEKLKEGHPVSACEHMARASDAYGQQLNDLGAQYRDAMRVIEKSDALHTMFESARSIHSMEAKKLNL